MYIIHIITWDLWWQSEKKRTKTAVGAHTMSVVLAKSPRVLISSLGQWHGLAVHRICTGCSKGAAVSAMNVHARPRPKLCATVGAFEPQGYRQLFPAPRNSSVRTPPHDVTAASGVAIDATMCRLSLTRRRTGFDGEETCHPRQHKENTHKPMHINGWFPGMDAHSSWPSSRSEWRKNRTKC